MPAKPLTKTAIIAKVAEEAGITKVEAKTAIEAMVNLSYKQAKVGFTVPGLGKLTLVKRKARMGRNPATGASIKIPAKKVLKFRISKIAKDAVL